jgi:hypothetical protein
MEHRPATPPRRERAGTGYLPAVIPDDRADRPLTPGERAAIADLERRLLLDAPESVRNRAGSRRRPAAAGRFDSPTSAAVALIGVAVVLIALLVVAGGGVLGGVAVLASVVGTGLVWRLVPARFGGPTRRFRRPYRIRGRLLGRRR